MPPAMKRLLADLQLPANRFDRRALVEVHLRLAQLRNDLLRRVSLPFHRVLPPSQAVRLSYQLVHLEGVRSPRARVHKVDAYLPLLRFMRAQIYHSTSDLFSCSLIAKGAIVRSRPLNLGGSLHRARLP